MSGAVSTLIKRRLGYHYIINKNGDIHEFVPANRWTPHAYKNNRGTVGISFVGGGKFGPISDVQISSLIVLLTVIKEDYPTIRELSGHEQVDPRGWKTDPQWPGEKPGKDDPEIDRYFMEKIAKATGLTYIDGVK